MKIQPIDNWKASWRLWSVQFAAAVALLPELAYRLAEALEGLLPAIAGPVLDNLPPSVRATCAVLALVAALLRLLKQPAKAS